MRVTVKAHEGYGVLIYRYGNEHVSYEYDTLAEVGEPYQAEAKRQVEALKHEYNCDVVRTSYELSKHAGADCLRPRVVFTQRYSEDD